MIVFSDELPEQRANIFEPCAKERETENKTKPYIQNDLSLDPKNYHKYHPFLAPLSNNKATETPPRVLTLVDQHDLRS